jgi:uncharacterized membrane protein
MKSFLVHIKSNLVRGAIAMIPLTLSFIAIFAIYNYGDKRMGNLLERLFGINIPGVGLLTVLVILYVVGILVTNTVGRQGMRFIEHITNRIPLVKTTYQIGKQLSNTLSLPEKQVFKKAVLVEYLKPGIWTIGFVTGSVVDHRNNDMTLLKVFVPTPPSPMSGTMVLVKEDQIKDPGWTIEEALKTVISGGIIGPSEIT